MSPLFFVGFGLAAIGFIILFVLLASQGAMAKSRQFAAMGDLAAGRAGSGKRALFFLALLAMFFGTCGVFGGVTAGDAQRRKACETTCKDKGYKSGKIRGSAEKSGGKHAFVACACEGGPDPDPLELKADSLGK